MHKKSFIPLILFGLVVLIVVTPVSARVVESGGTITAGETGLELAFVDDCPSAKFGWWPSIVNTFSTSPSFILDLSNYDDHTFDPSVLAGYNIPGVPTRFLCYDEGIHTLSQGEQDKYFREAPHFFLKFPVITTIPTPTPTPSEGTITISSYPPDATVYIDNHNKGITPIKLTIENGDHAVKIKLDGYKEYSSIVSIQGDSVTISQELIPVTTVTTTVPTTVYTTVPTIAPTTVLTTQIATIPTTATINYSETIAVMQSKIAAQETKNIEQDVAIEAQSEQIGTLQQLIDSILGFLGLK